MIRILLPLIFVFCHQLSYAQNKRANIWYFGTNAGIDFNSGSAVSINNGVIVTGEGSAVMCDTSGALLFYTDGIQVYDRSHTQMPNGFGLLGGNSSSQSALIVPDPGNSNQYYIFTILSDATGGLNYSLVDMTLNASFGDITTKNSPLISLTGEKITGYQKPGTNDIWIVTHEWGTSSFYSYLLTAAGLNAPVITSVGQVHSTSGSAIGYMKISPAGDKLALALSRDNNFELFDFDANTGVVSNPIILPATDITYGIEFSRDGKILYASEFQNKIYQYDLTLGSAAAIIASQLLLLPLPVGSEIGSIQMAPDGKIYVCKNSSQFTGVINNPDTLGQGCNYVDLGFSIAPNNGQEGLPNFMQSIFTQAPQVPTALLNTPDNHICPGTCIDFINLSQNATSFLWSFAGATPSTSTDVNPTSICYNTPGAYAVELIAINGLTSDTLMLNNFITVYPFPAPQGILQSGDTLFANAGAISYQWYHNGDTIPGATDYFYVATESGNYNVVATDDNGCEVEAVINDVIANSQSAVFGSQFAVYPVPAVDEILVKGIEWSNIVNEISVYNMTGEIVLEPNHVISQMVQGISLYISSLATGIYWLQIETKEKTIRGKFLKK